MESMNENSNENNSENTNENNFAQSVKADKITDGLMSVPKLAEESTPTPYIENSPQEAGLAPMVEEKPKDEPLISENPPLEPAPTEAEPKADSTEFKEAEKQEELSESEKEMLQVMEALQGKYPHAFVEETDKYDRRYVHFKGPSSGVENTSELRITIPYSDNDPQGYIYFCKEGVIRVNKSSHIYSGSTIVDDFFRPDGRPNGISMGEESQKGDRRSAIFSLRSTHVDLHRLKDDFSKYEELHKDDVDVVEPKELTTEEIIDSL